MPTISTDTIPKSKRSRSTPRTASPELGAKPVPPIGKSPKTAADAPEQQRVTKQERVLALLTRSSGASVEEIMQVTTWQQHSVRGFLAGTVKKKLGLELASSKPNDEVRRYRIVARRGR